MSVVQGVLHIVNNLSGVEVVRCLPLIPFPLWDYDVIVRLFKWLIADGMFEERVLCEMGLAGRSRRVANFKWPKN